MQLTTTLDASTDYLRLVWCLGRERGALQAAINRCASHAWRDTRCDKILRASASAGTTILRAVTTPGTTTDATFAAALAAYGEASTAFVAAGVAPHGAFDRLASASRKASMHSSFAVTTYGATGYEHIEAVPKAISQLGLGSGTLVPRATSCTVVVNDELFRFAVPIGMPLIGQELGHGVARCSDQIAIPALVSGIEPLDSAGSDAAAVAADVGALLGAVTFGADAQLRLLMHTDHAKAIATMMTPNGGRAFAGMSPLGGELFGVEVIVSDELEESSSGGRALVLVDCSQIAADADALMVSSSIESLLQLDDSPIGGSGAVMRSLYQENKRAMRAERSIAIARLRDSAVAWIDDALYGTP